MTPQILAIASPRHDNFHRLDRSITERIVLD